MLNADPADGNDVEARVIRLSERLKTARAERGISQAQAARELDVARTAYRLWEKEAARPAPDRWRLVARWLDVSITTLLLAEGLMSEDEQRATDAASDRYESATGTGVDAATSAEEGNFFEQARSFLDRRLEQGLVTTDEARQFEDMLDRIRKRTSAE